MKVALLVAVLVLAACSSSSSPAARSSSTPPAPGLNCRLPVTWAVQNGSSLDTKAGFVTFPGQTLREDPAAPARSTFYDRGLAKWLPTWRSSVSPDGRRYAYSEGNAYVGTEGKLHVVDVATGVDRVIYRSSRVYGVIDFAAEGIYLTGAVPEGYPIGLWLEDPRGGTPRLISSSVVSPAVGGGYAWGLDFNTADPSPGPGGIEGPKNRILRFDLRSGVATPWFYRPGASLYVLGFDSRGEPFVTADFVPSPADVNGQDSVEVWLITSGTSATEVFEGSGIPVPRLAAVDSYGVWFDGSYLHDSRVWLYANGSMQQVAAVSVDYFAVAGGCIP